MHFIKQLIRKKNLSHYLEENVEKSSSLPKVLNVWDLTAFGVAAILGAGIFSTIGNAAAMGGPGVVLLFIFTAIACGFSALCYAEFASMVPVSGSAYTYAYLSFGEIFGWIVGWNLLLEYAISNIVVSISWSQYFVDFLHSYSFDIPSFLTTNYFVAQKAYLSIEHFYPDMKLSREVLAWLTAPECFNIKIIFDFPTVLITFMVTVLIFYGMRESRFVSNLLVILKMLIIFLVIAIGAPHVKSSNWVPFAPEGLHGILQGISSTFFAYIGFDAVSTTAEECKNPQVDIPKSMIYSLIICTAVYSVVALILTGLVPYSTLNVADPLAFVFGKNALNIPWISTVVQVGALFALSSVLLVYQLGQPRIWMSMSRDGLLPEIFSSIHPRYQTPWFSTIITGLLVIIPSLFFGITEVTELASIGTISSFMLVCAGILVINPYGKKNGKFVTPYIQSRFLFPFLLITVAILMFYILGPTAFLNPTKGFILQMPKIIFIIVLFGLAILSVLYNLSLLPMLGVACSGYLLVEMNPIVWKRFLLWLLAGLLCYFLYGIRNSKLKGLSKLSD